MAEYSPRQLALAEQRWVSQLICRLAGEKPPFAVTANGCSTG